MTFAITKYIYPIEHEIVISKSMGYTLDNPRTKEEIDIVRGFIEETLLDKNRREDSRTAPLFLRAKYSIDDLKEILKSTDGYALNYLSNLNDKKIVDILSEIWIIFRFPEEEEFLQLAKDKNELIHKIIVKEESSYTIQFKNVVSYCHLLSLLIHNEENYYHGESFLLSEYPYEIFLTSNNSKIYEAIENFVNDNFSTRNGMKSPLWLYWPDILNTIVETAVKLESLLVQENKEFPKKQIPLSQKQTPKQKLLHIGNILSAAYAQVINPELMLLLLVSIIEYLVTGNPDTNRFNVEDSINKQFKLKCAILIHNQDKEYDLRVLNSELKNIYSQRSNIAHGNYKENFKLEDIINSTYLLHKFNRDILNEFLSDRQLIEYLKDN
jgi:hypothetical protein